MVLSALRRRLGPGNDAWRVDRSDEAVPAVVFPDESAWLLWGRGLRRFGFEAVPSPLAARVLVAPSRVPDGLVEAVADAWRQLPQDRHYIPLDEPEIGGRPLEEVLREAIGDGEGDEGEDDPGSHEHQHDHGGHGGGEGHDHHGGGGHGEDSGGGGQGQATGPPSGLLQTSTRRRARALLRRRGRPSAAITTSSAPATSNRT